MSNKNVSVQTKVTEETKEKLEKKVEDEGETESSYVRKLIVNDLKGE